MRDLHSLIRLVYKRINLFIIHETSLSRWVWASWDNFGWRCETIFMSKTEDIEEFMEKILNQTLLTSLMWAT